MIDTIIREIVITSMAIVGFAILAGLLGLAMS